MKNYFSRRKVCYSTEKQLQACVGCFFARPQTSKSNPKFMLTPAKLCKLYNPTKPN